ncbi:hypothetical protein BDZ91DRAFT_811783, partial [Kalaharituber pfeilii]
MTLLPLARETIPSSRVLHSIFLLAFLQLQLPLQDALQVFIFHPRYRFPPTTILTISINSIIITTEAPTAITTLKLITTPRWSMTLLCRHIRLLQIFLVLTVECQCDLYPYLLLRQLTVVPSCKTGTAFLRVLLSSQNANANLNFGYRLSRRLDTLAANGEGSGRQDAQTMALARRDEKEPCDEGCMQRTRQGVALKLPIPMLAEHAPHPRWRSPAISGNRPLNSLHKEDTCHDMVNRVNAAAKEIEREMAITYRVLSRLRGTLEECADDQEAQSTEANTAEVDTIEESANATPSPHAIQPQQAHHRTQSQAHSLISDPDSLRMLVEANIRLLKGLQDSMRRLTNLQTKLQSTLHPTEEEADDAIFIVKKREWSVQRGKNVKNTEKELKLRKRRSKTRETVAVEDKLPALGMLKGGKKRRATISFFSRNFNSGAMAKGGTKTTSPAGSAAPVDPKSTNLTTLDTITDVSTTGSGSETVILDEEEAFVDVETGDGESKIVAEKGEASGGFARWRKGSGERSGSGRRGSGIWGIFRGLSVGGSEKGIGVEGSVEGK